MNLNINKPIAFFDLETTGTNILKDRIIEISIIKILPSGKKIEYTKRINPKIQISPQASKISGIYEKDIINCPSFSELSKEIKFFFGESDLAGFNILKFDIPLLLEEFNRNKIDFSIEKRKIVDVQKIFHIMEKRTLSAAFKFYCKKELINAHSARADTEATIAILEEQIKKYEKQKVKDNLGNEIHTIENNISSLHKLSTQNMIDLSGRLIYNEKNRPVFNFGKYKGVPVNEVFTKDPNYYDWIMKSSFSKDTKQKLTKLKLES